MKMLIPALALLSTTAMAADYKINMEGRVDLVNNTKKTTTAAGVTTEEKSNSFVLNLLRVNLLGKINDDLTYRMRYRFYGVPAATARDGAGNKLDLIYVDHKNSMFTARIGKQSWAEAFGRESFVASSDLLISSDVKANYAAAIGEYRMGASAMFKLMDSHNLTIALSNPNVTKTDTTGVSQKNNSLAYSVFYNSSFLDKMVQPTLGYTLASQDGDEDAAVGSKTVKKDTTLWAAGVRSEISGAVIDLDYKELKIPEHNGTGSNSFVEKKTKSLYANVAYAINEWTPFATYINDKYAEASNAVAEYKKDSMAFGVMYKPFADMNFRYHAVYTSAVTKYASNGSAKVDDKNIVLGFKADL